MLQDKDLYIPTVAHKSQVTCFSWPLMQGWVCGQAACAFKFFIFLHNLTCPPARGVEPAWLFLGPELWRLGYRDTEKEFYCVVSAGQTFNPSILFIKAQTKKPRRKCTACRLSPDTKHNSGANVWACWLIWLFIHRAISNSVYSFWGGYFL